MTQTSQTEALYKAALEQYRDHPTNDTIAAAAKQFAALGDYKRAAWYLEKCKELLAFAVGNTVTFGKVNGTPIRWKVLDQRGKMRLLFAEDIVAQQPYNTMRIDISWKTCSLRHWLNHEFIEQTFTPEEAHCLVASNVLTGPNPVYATVGGDSAVDKLFLPDLDSFEKFCPSLQERICRDHWWWLRSPGCNLLSAVTVDEEGLPYVPGININHPAGGVRPAMWIMIKA